VSGPGLIEQRAPYIDYAVCMANDSICGLSSQVYGADTSAATAIARRLRAGAANVNSGMFSAYAPSGGYQQSGLGRERGIAGIRAFHEVKHLLISELPG
jgi:aldehyde dehydrogenase (NAD+)